LEAKSVKKTIETNIEKTDLEKTTAEGLKMGHCAFYADRRGADAGLTRGWRGAGAGKFVEQTPRGVPYQKNRS